LLNNNISLLIDRSRKEASIKSDAFVPEQNVSSNKKADGMDW